MASSAHRTISARRQRSRERALTATRSLRSDQHGSRDASTRTASLDQCRAELQDNHLARSREVLAYGDKALALVEELKDNCRELLRREEGCLSRLDRLNPTPSELITFQTVLQGLRKPIPERLVFSKNGLIVSFMPAKEEKEDETVESEVDTTSNHPSPDMSALITDPIPATSTPPAISTSCPRETEAQDSTGLSTTSLPPCRPRRPPAPIILTSETVSSRRASRSKKKRWIRPREVKARNYWVFEHSHRADPPTMYILRCPKDSCQQPVFSRHPLKENRAESHFKACGVRFKSLSDLVSRYAYLVVPDRPSHPVTKKWAKEHNEKLIGKNENSLFEENIWPGINELGRASCTE